MNSIEQAKQVDEAAALVVDEQIWPAGVKTRTIAGALVMYPVVVAIDGQQTKLSLDDARQLLAGLGAAVEAVAASEDDARKRDHVMIYGPSHSGISSPKASKLPLGPYSRF